MKIERINYLGWKNCVRITHQDLTLVITTAVGPRVIHCGFTGGENLFYVHPQQAGTVGGNDWKTFGGHRLWCAPEDLATTYFPDNFPLQVEEIENGVRFTPSIESNGVQKSIAIQPAEGRNRIKIEHMILNRGNHPLHLAPWALSVMRAGGTAIIPHNLDRPNQLLPTHSISLWGYTTLNDPRWYWGKRYIFLKQDPSASTPQKVGLQDPYGWAGYAVNNQFFLKRFDWQPNGIYPDFNCNFEAYTNPDILELETLGPLTDLKPGDLITHREEWALFDNVPLPVTETDLDTRILPLVTSLNPL